VLLYVKRRLKAPMQALDGALAERARGTRQAGVVSPLRASLFLR
jgi:retron-type reverse transcriptase